MKQFRILAPTAILGYGFPVGSFQRGLELEPHLIAVDGGSTDPGPYYLGSGKPFTDRAAVKRDLRYMLVEGVRRGIPVIIGTAGGSGAAPHLAWCRDIVAEVAHEEGLTFRLGIIPADVATETVVEAFLQNRLTPLEGVPGIDETAIRACTHIVAQMGTEPFAAALDLGCQVILAGRAYDPAVFAAMPIMQGYPAGLAIHLGKILECAAIAAEPGSGADAALGILREDRFELVPLNPERRFTRRSTAAHSLYEKSDPLRLPGPGGLLNLTACRFEESGDGRITVHGSAYEPAVTKVKLEGARPLGYRTVCIAGVRDPIMIDGIQSILSELRRRLDGMLAETGIAGKVWFHLYGTSGVMGSREPARSQPAHELGIVIEAVADTQAQADTICSMTRSTLLHYGYPGRIATAGNLAFPFSPSDLSTGACYGFVLCHLMDYREGMFPVETVEIGGSR